METNPNSGSTFAGNDEVDSSASARIEAVSESLKDDLGDAAHQVREDVEQVRDSVVDAAEVLRNAAVDCVTDIAAVVRDLVRERPLVAIGAATAAGYILACIRGARGR